MEPEVEVLVAVLDVDWLLQRLGEVAVDAGGRQGVDVQLVLPAVFPGVFYLELAFREGVRRHEAVGLCDRFPDGVHLLGEVESQGVEALEGLSELYYHRLVDVLAGGRGEFHVEEDDFRDTVFLALLAAVLLFLLAARPRGDETDGVGFGNQVEVFVGGSVLQGDVQGVGAHQVGGANPVGEGVVVCRALQRVPVCDVRVPDERDTRQGVGFGIENKRDARGIHTLVLEQVLLLEVYVEGVEQDVVWQETGAYAIHDGVHASGAQVEDGIADGDGFGVRLDGEVCEGDVLLGIVPAVVVVGVGECE